ncbi:MAG TPA: glycosyltransferase family 2 protein [Thermoanaerobaculia bacterium]|nr:glycosyltransferase family 2 protein [Thermoanaerobaculia bacterium]
MGTVRLSVCIPIYNFGAFVAATLESIVRQVTEEVEVVILDGGSTDNTAEVVEGYRWRFPRFRYERQEKRGGIDRDMAKAVALATGEYCWVFSGDDLMREGSVARVLSAIQHGGCDVYLLESMLCRFDMTPVALHRLLRSAKPRTFRLHERRERSEYFRLANNTAAFFSFCSAVVVKRSRWNSVTVDESFYGTCWAHAARIFGMLESGLVVRYLPGAFLDKRGDNDSFLTNGPTRRFAIAVDGYNKIADEFFGYDSAEAFHIRRAVRGELPLTQWLLARLDVAAHSRAGDPELFDRLVRTTFCDPSVRNWITLVLARSTPLWMLKLAQRALRAWRGARATRERPRAPCVDSSTRR